MTRLNKLRAEMDELFTGVNLISFKARATEIKALLDEFISAAEKMSTQLKKYRTAFKDMATVNKELTEKNDRLAEQSKESVLKKLRQIQLERDLDEALTTLERIPAEIIEQYKLPPQPHKTRER